MALRSLGGHAAVPGAWRRLAGGGCRRPPALAGALVRAADDSGGCPGLRRQASSAAALGWGASASAVDETSGRWCPRALAQAARGLAAGHAEFSLRVAASSIPDSGLGVFVDRVPGAPRGAIPAGTVVALYAGVYIPLVPLHARAAARGDQVVMDVVRLASVHGYAVVDERLEGVSYDEASSYWLILEVFSGIMDGFRPEQRVDTNGSRSPFAVGQLINHPMRGVAPNVDWQEFRWDAEDPDAPANRLHRGLWYIDPATGDPVDMPAAGGVVRLPLPGVAIVSLRDLEAGDELYMNYRYNPPYPPWYTPVDRAPA